MSVTIEGLLSVESLILQALGATDVAVDSALQDLGRRAIQIMQQEIYASIYERPGHPATRWQHGRRWFETPAGEPGEKSTGELEDSVVAFFDSPGDGSLRLRVGSAKPQAYWASIDIGAKVFNRPMFMNPPGRWRWIATRGRISKHPFLERSEVRLLDLFEEKFRDYFNIETAIIRNPASPELMLEGFMSIAKPSKWFPMGGQKRLR